MDRRHDRADDPQSISLLLLYQCQAYPAATYDTGRGLTLRGFDGAGDPLRRLWRAVASHRRRRTSPQRGSSLCRAEF
jgi:hypothetical protein